MAACGVDVGVGVDGKGMDAYLLSNGLSNGYVVNVGISSIRQLKGLDHHCSFGRYGRLLVSSTRKQGLQLCLGFRSAAVPDLVIGFY